MTHPYRNPLVAAATIIAVGILPADTHALDAAILEAFKEQVTKQVCSDGGKWLRCYKLDPSACTTITNSLVAPCTTKVFGPINDRLEEGDARKLAEQFQSCFNERFENKYGEFRVQSAECAQPAKHMQDSK